MASCYRESEITAAAERACEWLELSLHDRQREVIEKFVCGHDVFVSLPTASSKSLCYECFPWMFDQLRGTGEQARSIVVVVTLLISLMKYRELQVQRRTCLITTIISTPCTAASDYKTLRTSPEGGPYIIPRFLEDLHVEQRIQPTIIVAI